jgi:hypothetical protein
MAEFKVREVSSVPEKSVQEVQEVLIKEHEKKEELKEDAEKVNEASDGSKIVEANYADATEDEVEDAIVDLKDIDVLSYIKNKYDKDINSMDELFKKKDTREDLPEDISALLNFKKETGRGIEDFIKLNKDYDKLDQEQLLEDYLKQTNPHLDDEDLSFEMSERFGYDEELDDEGEVRRRKIAKKKELVKAKEYFNKLKEQYKAPLESSDSFVPQSEKENYEAYKKQAQESNDMKEHYKKRQEYFLDKTTKLFSEDFKGFDFTVGDKQMVYNPGSPEKLKEAQSDVANYINSHISEEGYIKDAKEYHKSLAVAMNPEGFAKFFYEQGKSDAIGDVTRESKNVDMPVRRSPESVNKGGMKVVSLETNHGSGLRIKSRKK